MSQRVELAAALGDEAARRLVSSPPTLPEHYRSKLEKALACLTSRETIRFAIECVRRTLPAWDVMFPDDRRPGRAVAAAELWLSGDCSASDLSWAGASAQDAGHEADDQQLTPMDDLRLFAIHASAAAAHVAHTAESAAGDGSEVAECAAWAGTFARKATTNTSAEEQWQLKRLADYLMGRCPADESP